MASASLGTVVSSSPGRLRLRIARPNRAPQTFSAIRKLLAGLPGVAAVEVNPATGSVLVSYDPTALDLALLLRLGSDVGWIPPQSEPAGATTSLSFAEWWRR